MSDYETLNYMTIAFNKPGTICTLIAKRNTRWSSVEMPLDSLDISIQELIDRGLKIMDEKVNKIQKKEQIQ